MLSRALVIVERQRDLPEVIGATGPPGRLAGRLHRRQEQADERADDGDHHEEFDQREPGRSHVAGA